MKLDSKPLGHYAAGKSVKTGDMRDYRSNGHTPSGFYAKAVWRKLRQVVLNREPLCRSCKGKGKNTPATVVDHIHEVRDGGDLYDERNLQPLCESCHNSKTMTRTNEKRRD